MLGAITSSFVFFFSLGYGARLLRPLFAKPKAWRVLDAIIGVTMLALATKLGIGKLNWCPRPRPPAAAKRRGRAKE